MSTIRSKVRKHLIKPEGKRLVDEKQKSRSQATKSDQSIAAIDLIILEIRAGTINMAGQTSGRNCRQARPESTILTNL
jgi:hypothetical protein